MEQIGILYNSHAQASRPLADNISSWLAERGCQAHLTSILEVDQLKERLDGLALLIVLGGDGTTLLAGRLAAPYSVPIFGVNLGRVGFLSESSPQEWPEKLARVLDNDYWLENRLMLKASIRRGEESFGDLVALNELVVSRGTPVRLVRCDLYVDGEHVITYVADGLIAATPTGSTAYSMAAGGPILPPQLKNFLILPVAPHLSFERALVLHREANIAIEISTDHEAIVSADGQNAQTLQDGDRVVITQYEHSSAFARTGSPAGFYRRLVERLNFWSLNHQR